VSLPVDAASPSQPKDSLKHIYVKIGFFTDFEVISLTFPDQLFLNDFFLTSDIPVISFLSSYLVVFAGATDDQKGLTRNIVPFITVAGCRDSRKSIASYSLKLPKLVTVLEVVLMRNMSYASECVTKQRGVILSFVITPS